MLRCKNLKGFCLLNMAENEQDYSSSTSEDDVDSVQSLEEDKVSVQIEERSSQLLRNLSSCEKKA